jgi:hypothetical protein
VDFRLRFGLSRILGRAHQTALSPAQPLSRHRAQNGGSFNRLRPNPPTPFRDNPGNRLTLKAVVHVCMQLESMPAWRWFLCPK